MRVYIYIYIYIYIYNINRERERDCHPYHQNYLNFSIGSPHGLIANTLGCDIVVSSNSSFTSTFTFGLMPSGEVWTLLSRSRWLDCTYTILLSVGWGRRIHRLYFWGRLRPPQRQSWIWHKKSHGKVPVILKLWGMQSTPSLPSQVYSKLER